MNWYQKNKNIGLIKTAKANIETEGQDVETSTIYDSKHYTMDTYNVTLTLTPFSNQICIALLVSHGFLGSVGYDAYWYFDVNETKEAKETFNKINDKLDDIKREFIKDETPTTLYWPTVKSIVGKIDLDHQLSSNIPYVNYSKHLNIDPDWRQNIYGNRYPKHMEQSRGQWARQMREIWPRS